jgi:hypothetical protein
LFISIFNYIVYLFIYFIIIIIIYPLLLLLFNFDFDFIFFLSFLVLQFVFLTLQEEMLLQPVPPPPPILYFPAAIHHEFEFKHAAPHLSHLLNPCLSCNHQSIHQTPNHHGNFFVPAISESHKQITTTSNTISFTKLWPPCLKPSINHHCQNHPHQTTNPFSNSNHGIPLPAINTQTTTPYPRSQTIAAAIQPSQLHCRTRPHSWPCTPPSRKEENASKMREEKHQHGLAAKK